jgi:hypothetical protein
MKPHECHVSFYQQHVRVTLDRPKELSRRGNVTTSSGPNDGKLSLSIQEGANTGTSLKTWQDSDGLKLETQMTEVAVEIVLTAEIRYREGAIRQYQWRVDRKTQLEAEERSSDESKQKNLRSFDHVACAKRLSRRFTNSVSIENNPAPKMSTINAANRKVYGSAT